MKISLIISVYKNIQDLRIVLDGLHFQSYTDFEIIISEDGDFEPMQQFLAEYKTDKKIVHLKQKDEGWRKNKALNQAITKASGDYLIFIDGDCVLHHKFIENHLRFSAPDRILGGKRIKLGPVYSQLLRSGEQLLVFEKRILKEMRSIKKDGAKFYEEGIYIDPKSFFSFIPKLRKINMLKGCNMSCHRAAIEKINGFDEDYILPAIGEDIDLTWRFRGLGFKIHSVRNLAVQYHLHHKENWSDQSINQSMMNQKKKNNLYVCLNGLKKSGSQG